MKSERSHGCEVTDEAFLCRCTVSTRSLMPPGVVQRRVTSTALWDNEGSDAVKTSCFLAAGTRIPLQRVAPREEKTGFKFPLF
ncbi:hypothetical protein EYF80_032080 [Liparis tanakae]|uniref:Uncharacterized protein n=1 Tax=Liparis tanakae TaxID=230148 RepID=A0A4Z2GYH8_9TELE|nr:hypothetical protein EYF80_032080 [Liparis tanakae]